MMTPKQFQATACAILGTVVDWQSKIARQLDVSEPEVAGWLKNEKIPAWVNEKFKTLVRADGITPWPRDEWMIGDAFSQSGKSRSYIAHLQFPRFVARIVDIDDDGKVAGHERPADIESGIVYQIEAETFLCEIDFIDPIIEVAVIRQWLEAAGDEIARQDEILSIR